MDPSAHALRAFLTTARLRHFTRAAEELHVSGPALSQLIRRLERDLGLDLFVRNTRTVTLTAAGEGLVPYAERVARSLDDLERWRKSVLAASRRALRFGFTVNGAGDLMAEILRAARKILPEVEVIPGQVDWADLPGCVLSGRQDLAIARGPRHLPGARFRPVRSEPWVVVMPSDHPLAGDASIGFHDIQRIPFVLPQLGPSEERPPWLGGRDRHGTMPPTGPSASGLEEALDHVLVGDGVFLIGSSAARLYPRPGIAYVPVTDLEPGFIGLVLDPTRDDPLVNAFADLVEDVARRLPADAS